MTRQVAYTSWAPPTGLRLGDHDGTALGEAGLTITSATATRSYADPHRDSGAILFEQASWTSPEVATGFPARDVIVSWNATTPPGSWLEVAAAATLDEGSRTGWYVLARWAETDEDILPTSLPGQDDSVAEVPVDTLRIRPPRTIASCRVRLRLMRRPGGAAPSVRLVGVMVSDEAARVAEAPAGAGASAPASAAGVVGRAPLEAVASRPPGEGGNGVTVDVPAYSQQLHRGEYPHWDSGGASWCSPTSTAMVLAYWGRLPAPSEYAWVDPRFPDRFVDHAARHTFDYSYRGAGNWTFNTAYAARYGLTAFVTRLRGLAEAEQFIRAGIPLVVGVSFTEEELEGAGYGTQGHLLTIVGFTDDGDVVSNDPASHGIPSNAEVRTTYDREQFEKAWLGMSGGITYVIHPPEVELPPRPAQPNW